MAEFLLCVASERAPVRVRCDMAAKQSKHASGKKPPSEPRPRALRLALREPRRRKRRVYRSRASDASC